MKAINLESLSWCNAGSKVVGFNEVLQFIKNNHDKFEIHVGCDSHFIRDKCVFAIVIALYEPGRGGTYFFARSRVSRSDFLNMKLRLLKEVELSIATADKLIGLQNREDMFVHLDINPDTRFKSSQVFTSATSWVKSQGYNCVVKPDSWASSWLADAYAK